jgi:hypothetical protein
MMYKYTVLEAGVNEEGGGVAWAIGPYPTTTISWNNGLLSGMTDLGAMIDEVGESIKGTVPSDSWPTAEGTTICDLDWGIATRSADGNYEYLHVLKSPSGTTLTIDAPADGRVYSSAVNLRTGNSCSFSQTSSQVSITLNDSDSWDTVDAVIKLSQSNATQVNEIWTSQELYTLYPNPADDKIYIVSNQNDSNDGMIEISNLGGKVLNNIVLSSFDMELDISDLNTGFYILKIKTERGISIHKIFKK